LHGKEVDQDFQIKKKGPWSPLRQPFFRALWIATLVSNIGTWMQSTAAAWRMASIAPNALMVSMVQTAISLPVFLLALPAGALADVIDRRRLILFTQGWMLFAALALGILTVAGQTTPWLLLLLTLLLGLGTALNAPAWQAIVPEMVDKEDIPSAVALNSANFNVARSVGPALGGVIIGIAGFGTAFLINAMTYVGVMLVLFNWHRTQKSSALPAERIVGAIRTGFRYVSHASVMQAVLYRTLAFTVGASALMALLPLLAKRDLGLSSMEYGLLVGSFGFGAVMGALVLPTVRRRVTVDTMVVLSTLLFALVLSLLPLFRQYAVLCGLLVLGGASWLAILSSFNSSVQTSVPSWVRGRALAFYMLVFFGGMAAGSLLWGTVASLIGIHGTILSSSVGLVIGLCFTYRFRLSGGELANVSPSGHWPVPTVLLEPRPEDGPVLVTIEYRIEPEKWHDFATAMKKLRSSRMRSGAMRWGLYVDTGNPCRHVESFLVESWVEHLRQHERITVEDRQLESLVLSFHSRSRPLKITHFLAKPLPPSKK